MKKIIGFVCLIMLFTGFSSAQNLNISIPNEAFQIDNSLNLILIQKGQVNYFEDLDDYDSVSLISSIDTLVFENIDEDFEPGISYNINFQEEVFQVNFTSLPIISISPQDSIVDEPKRPATLIYADEFETYSSALAIELRGGSSLSFPKKTYDIELRYNLIGDSSVDHKFQHLRNDDDWILDASYNEPLRIRSMLCHQLWLDMHTPYYINNEPSANPGANLIQVELFLDGSYNGVYNLSEPIDRKTLKLKKFNGDIRGELYKAFLWGAPTFLDTTTYDNSNRVWDGYEYKYPKIADTTNWNSIFDFTEFVVYSEDIPFMDNVWNYAQQDNFTDYFIFFNLIRGLDNTAKNTYTAKYKQGHPYIYVPWDLDGTLGNSWDGVADSTTYGIISNRFYNRLLDLPSSNFHSDLCIKWANLRNGVLSYSNLENRICSAYNYLNENGVYDRELLVYPNYNFDDIDKNYMLEWLEKRFVYLDWYFGYVGLHELEQSSFSMYPNPANKILTVNIPGNSHQYAILNTSGQIVQFGAISDQQIINIEKIQSGVYFLKINNKVEKLIIE